MTSSSEPGSDSTAPKSTSTGEAGHGEQEGTRRLSDSSRDRGEMTGPAPSGMLGGRAAPFARTSSPGRHVRPEPLGKQWVTVTVVIGIMAALIALGGMVLSFHAVSVEMVPAFGIRWAWLVPIVVDLTVFVFSGVDLVLARLDMGHPLARWTVYGATFGTVWLNYSAGGNLAGRVAHVLMPSIWVVFIELMRHVVRRQVNLATASHREPVPAARWLLSPWPTLKLWRRMVLWRINSYPRALDAERIRLTRIAEQRQLHGRFWRFKIDPLTRLSISLGETETLPPALPPSADRAEQRTTPGAEGPSTLQPEQSALPAWLASALAERQAQQSYPRAPEQSDAVPSSQPRAVQSGQSEADEQSGSRHSAPPSQSATANQSDDALECLTEEETAALDRLTAQCAPRIPSQGAIRAVLPPGPDGRRCGATRAIRIQKALRARAEEPDDPDPLTDAIDSELAASTP